MSINGILVNREGQQSIFYLYYISAKLLFFNCFFLICYITCKLLSLHVPYYDKCLKLINY